MPKNIVICCGGTNNQFDGYHSNVIRTYKVARRSPIQVTYYDPGVGTMPEPWKKTRIGKRLSMLSSLVFGDGLSITFPMRTTACLSFSLDSFLRPQTNSPTGSKKRSHVTRPMQRGNLEYEPSIRRTAEKARSCRALPPGAYTAIVRGAGKKTGRCDR